MFESSSLWLLAWEELREKDKDTLPRTLADSPKALLDDIDDQTNRSKGRRTTLPTGEVFFIHDVLEKIARWVKMFVAVGDTAVQYDPGHAALPWAALRLVLQVSTGAVLTRVC